MAKDKTTAAIYIRVSTREQTDGYSLDSQQRILLDFCKAKKYDVYKIYADEGISAKDIKHRPGMLQLLGDARNKKFNAILIWKLTRFTRNIADLTTSCEMLDKLGISLMSYSEAFDGGTPAGRMVRSMLGSVAQFEREVISENVYMGMLERARQGKRTCGNVLGYDLLGKDSLKINEKEAEYVRFIFDNYLKRKSLLEVSQLAEIKGYRGKRGRKPAPESIRKILTRPIYAGYNTFCGNVYKGNHEPIIDIDTFNRVQSLLKRQGKVYGKFVNYPKLSE